MDMDASQQSRGATHSPIQSVRCSKCHAVNPREVSAKFCDQCGHQLLKKLRDKTSKHRSSRRKDAGKLSEADGGTCGIVVTTTSDGGWFWGQDDQLPSLVTTSDKPIQHKLVDLHEADRIGSDNQAQLQKSPTNRIEKAQTAHSVVHDRRSDLSRPLRRVQSFGESPSALLPPIAHAQRRPEAEPVVNIPPIAKSHARAEPAIPSKAAESSTRSSCALLWGRVLAEAIAEFESTNIILTAEIDSDERCMSVLAQRLHIEETSRSKYMVASGASQLQFKHQELEKKVRMNKEKLSMVQQRLNALYEQQECEEMEGGGGEPEHLPNVGLPISTTEPRSNQEMELKDHAASNSRDDTQDESVHHAKMKRAKKKKKERKQATTTPTEDERVCLELAAVKIQKRFRVLRARRLFAAMVMRAYQRVYDADSKQFFYYNPRTKESQWEVPQTLAKAQDIEKQQFRSRRRRAASARSLNVAASRIQALYRRRAARVALRQMLLQVYEKVYDADSDSYYYYCKKTKTSSWEKPKLLRDSDLDSPTQITQTAQPDQSSNSLEGSQHKSAAVKIQVLYRNRATRLFLRDLASGNIEKHFDEAIGAWYYYNHRTQQSFWEQPRQASHLAAMPKPN